MTVPTFYDELASRYHLIYEDWGASIDRQGASLDSLMREHFPGLHDILDVAIGIGTQSLGLSARGYRVIGSDLSSGAVRRAAIEASDRGLTIPMSVADFRTLPIATASVDVIVCADNSLPHVLSAMEILGTLREWRRCLKPGGGCIISMRDYGEPRASGTVEERPYGERIWNGHRYALRQLWTWQGPRYEVALEMRRLDGDGAPLPVIRSTYLAIAVAGVEELMREAGFVNVQRVDERFFQPVLIGHAPSEHS